MGTAKIINEKGEIIEYYIEDRLKNSLDNKVIPSLHKKDKDFVICIDGREGCQPKGSKVMLADGSFKNIEDIKIGDIVLSPQEDGSYVYSNVINLFKFKSKNIYDVCELHRQKRKLYSCSGNHHIPFNVKNEKTKKWGIKHYQAQDFFKKSNRDFHNTTTPTMFIVDKFKDKVNCYIEPYTLGAWLGDGHFSSNKSKKNNPLYNKQTIVKGHYRNMKSGNTIWAKTHPSKVIKKEYLNVFNRDIGITTNDLEIIEYISKYYPIMNFFPKAFTNAKTYRFSMLLDFAKQLMFYGLEGKGSGEKFIPKEALTSDVEYRKKLLAGLIDTDGTLSKTCSYSITTKSKQLAKDIEFLVYSLGGRCRINKIKKGIKLLNFIGEYFRVSFYLGDIELPILLKRKQRNRKFFYLSANRTSISLKKKSSDIVYGFELDSDSHWYVTDNYVITRNSGKSTFALQVGKYIDNTLNLKRVVFSPEDFREAVLKAKKGQCIIYDEAFTGFSSRASLSPINRVLVSLAMQMRQKNLCIIIVLPTIFLLDRYMALFRTRALIHVFENKGRRGYFRLYNYRLKKLLILMGAKTMSYNQKIARTNFNGRFYGKFALGDEKIEKEYRKHKEKALEDSEKTSMSSAQVRYREQRNLLIWLIRENLKLSYRQMEELLLEYGFSISYEQIGKICLKFGGLTKETDLNTK